MRTVVKIAVERFPLDLTRWTASGTSQGLAADGSFMEPWEEWEEGWRRVERKGTDPRTLKVVGETTEPLWKQEWAPVAGTRGNRHDLSSRVVGEQKFVLVEAPEALATELCQFCGAEEVPTK